MANMFFCQICKETKQYGQDGGIEVQAHIYAEPFGKATIHTICAPCFVKTQGGLAHADQLVTREPTTTSTKAVYTRKVNGDG